MTKESNGVVGGRIASDDVDGSCGNCSSISVARSLQLNLGPEYISYRPGQAGKQLAYIEGQSVISIANEIFGYDGWSSEVKEKTVDFCECGKDGSWTCVIAVVIRVCLAERYGGVYREDLGYGTCERAKTRIMALEKAGKEGVTDAIKRAFRQFGNATGNCVYDKKYLEWIRRVKSPYEKSNFQEDKLYRMEVNKVINDGILPKKRKLTGGVLDGSRANVTSRGVSNGAGREVLNGVDAKDLVIAFEDDDYDEYS